MLTLCCPERACDVDVNQNHVSGSTQRRFTQHQLSVQTDLSHSAQCQCSAGLLSLSTSLSYKHYIIITHMLVTFVIPVIPDFNKKITLSLRGPRDAPNMSALKIVYKRKISRRLRKNLHITISSLFRGEIIFEVGLFHPV